MDSQDRADLIGCNAVALLFFVLTAICVVVGA